MKVIGLLMEKEGYLGQKILLSIILLLKVNGGIKTIKIELKLSLDYKVAKDLKLEIGDSITFNIFGNSVHRNYYKF